MNGKPLLKPILLYTCLLGLLTVGTIYLATHSGMYMVILAGTGLLLVAVGGGTVDQMGVTQTENAGGKGGAELMVDSSGLKSTLSTDTSLRLNLLFYGLGVSLWSIVVLSALGDTLV